MKKLLLSLVVTSVMCSTALAAGYPPLTNNEREALRTIISDDVSVGFMGMKGIYDYGYKPVTATDIQDVYAANEVKGDREFKGNGLVISGTIHAIKSGVGDKPTVEMTTNDRIRTVSLEFQKEYEDLAVDLVKGQRVSFVCVGDGIIMGFPSAVNCAPVESAKKKITNEKIRAIADEISAGSFSDPKTPKVITTLKIYTKATNNYQLCKPDDFNCLTEAKNKYMSTPGAKGEAAAYLDAYSRK